METRAGYAVVGAFVLVLLAGLVAFAWWFTRAGEGREEMRTYEIGVAGNVGGLQQGSLVRFRGIPVGRVADIAINPEDFSEILIRIEVDARTPVRADTIARLDTQGITGVTFVQLIGGSADSPPLEAGDDGVARIAGLPSALERVTSEAPELLARLSALFNDANRERIEGILTGLETITTDLAGGPSEEGLVPRSGEALARVTLLADRLATLIGEPGREGDLAAQLERLGPTLTSVRAAANRLDEAGQSVVGLVEATRDPLTDFATGGLPELAQLVTETRQLVATLNRIGREFERDPTGFLLDGTSRGFEAPR